MLVLTDPKYRSDSPRALTFGQDRGQCADLDGVAQQGPSAMGLDVIDLFGGNTGLPVGSAENGFAEPTR